MTGPILLALDGSPFSERALPLALRLAQGFETKLELVTISEPVPTLDYADWNVAAETWAADYIQKVGDSCTDAPVSVATFSSSRDPARGIMDRATEVGASMIVAATHGRGPLTRAWLGSVADTLLRESSVPLLLVRPPEDDEGAEVDTAISSIAVALDGSEESDAAVPHAANLARALDAELHLVRVIIYPSEVASPYLPQTVALNQSVLESSRELASTTLKEQAAKLRGEGLNVQVHVTEDVQAAKGITRGASESGAGVIVMGTHGRGGLRRAMLGSTADKVVRSARVPVLVIPAPGRNGE